MQYKLICFDLDGTVRSAPGFQSPSGDLKELPLRSLGPFLSTSSDHSA